MMREAFAASEQFNIPVLLRLVTRLAHSRAPVKLSPAHLENKLTYQHMNKKDWTTIPSYARVLYVNLLAKQKLFIKYSAKSPFNRLLLNHKNNELGVITTGLGENYYQENLKSVRNKPSHLHIGVYPIPQNQILQLVDNVKKILIIEEGYPYVEHLLRGIIPSEITIYGKQDGTLPSSGELTPDVVRTALKLPHLKNTNINIMDLPKRPPRLCMGCPHADTFLAINDVLDKNDHKKGVVTSDIGCYSLGALAPYSTLDSIVCMGASIGMAKGASEAGVRPVIETIGDSTFIHSGLTSLVDAVTDNTDMTVVILNNATTAMTGGQEVQLATEQVVNMVKGLGVAADHIKVITPLKSKHQENVQILKPEIEYKGLSVIISKRECVLEVKKRSRRARA